MFYYKWNYLEYCVGFFKEKTFKKYKTKFKQWLSSTKLRHYGIFSSISVKNDVESLKFDTLKLFNRIMDQNLAESYNFRSPSYFLAKFLGSNKLNDLKSGIAEPEMVSAFRNNLSTLNVTCCRWWFVRLIPFNTEVKSFHHKVAWRQRYK